MKICSEKILCQQHYFAHPPMTYAYILCNFNCFACNWVILIYDQDGMQYTELFLDEDH